MGLGFRLWGVEAWTMHLQDHAVHRHPQPQPVDPGRLRRGRGRPSPAALRARVCIMRWAACRRGPAALLWGDASSRGRDGPRAGGGAAASEGVRALAGGGQEGGVIHLELTELGRSGAEEEEEAMATSQLWFVGIKMPRGPGTKAGELTAREGDMKPIMAWGCRWAAWWEKPPGALGMDTAGLKDWAA